MVGKKKEEKQREREEERAAEISEEGERRFGFLYKRFFFQKAMPHVPF